MKIFWKALIYICHLGDNQTLFISTVCLQEKGIVPGTWLSFNKYLLINSLNNKFISGHLQKYYSQTDTV